MTKISFNTAEGLLWFTGITQKGDALSMNLSESESDALVVSNKKALEVQRFLKKNIIIQGGF
jgi:hypothetical protein